MNVAMIPIFAACHYVIIYTRHKRLAKSIPPFQQASRAARSTRAWFIVEISSTLWIRYVIKTISGGLLQDTLVHVLFWPHTLPPKFSTAAGGGQEASA